MESAGIIGAGVAGLGAAWFLQGRFRTTLYEKEARLGGHANTVVVPEEGSAIPIDTGFMVFNKVTYPHLLRLFNELQVPVKPTEMSFSVRHDPLGLEYNGMGINRVFAQRRNVLRPRYHRLLLQILRFFRVARASLDDPALAGLTVEDFARRHRLGQDFLRMYLVPMSAAIWSISPGRSMDFPISTLLHFFHNHGFLGVTTHHPWFTVDGGSREYVRRMVPALGEIRRGAPVVSVEADPAGVTVRTGDGTSTRHDLVVLACHADEACALLSKPTAMQQELLPCFRYQDNLATLHTDGSVMPRRRRAWASWNYRIDPAEGGGERSSTHYYMNRLQQVSEKRDYFVSINYGDRIRPEAVLQTIAYTHPVFDREAVAAQARLPQINAEAADQRVFFCGSYFRYGFHEDALASAVDCCKAILRADPWER